MRSNDPFLLCCADESAEIRLANGETLTFSVKDFGAFRYGFPPNAGVLSISPWGKPDDEVFFFPLTSITSLKITRSKE